MNLFLISSALNAERMSVYSNAERLQQTLDTIRSIDTYCPNSVKYLFDVSATEPSAEIQKIIAEHGAKYVYNAADSNIKSLSQNGLKSLGELNNLYRGFHYLKNSGVIADRIYKISGRYRLNDTFDSSIDKYSGKFVFATALSSWLPRPTQDSIGVQKLLRTRLWHMDFKLLDTYLELLPKIYNDCARYGIDIEHSHYKNLSQELLMELGVIGVEGNIAPTGEFIRE